MALYHEEDPDLLSHLLIAQLALADIDEFETSKKGKTRADIPPTDEEVAFRVQADSLRLLLSDYAFARGLGGALESDQAQLDIFAERECGEQDDRNAAIAVSRGEPLPARTARQQMLSNPGLGVTDLGDDTIVKYPDAQSMVLIPSTSARSVVNGPSSSRTFINERSSYTPASIGRPVDQECAICMDTIQSSRPFLAPCNHAYCRDCLTNLVENATKDESLYPLRCCKQPLLVDVVLRHLPYHLRYRFRIKATEFDTPSVNRLYCHNATCSEFLGSTVDAPPSLDCWSCGSSTCTSCKSVAHTGKYCGQNAALVALEQLALEQHWQTCPGCHAIVELHQGCYHMTCRCRTQFCYLCAAPWKSCSCVQWDENRLVNAAEQQVVNQFGPRAQVEQPAVYQQRVEARVADLRDNHNCAHSSWTYRSGGGRCEECNFNLPTFLLRCRGCQMLACVRCTRNRL